jgi:hypothetical protein
LVGAALALMAAVATARFLPRTIAPEGAMHSATESLENVAELAIGGLPPAFGDTEDDAALGPVGASAVSEVDARQ